MLMERMLMHPLTLNAAICLCLEGQDTDDCAVTAFVFCFYTLEDCLSDSLAGQIA
jgi:hypothetical protein